MWWNRAIESLLPEPIDDWMRAAAMMEVCLRMIRMSRKGAWMRVVCGPGRMLGDVKVWCKSEAGRLLHRRVG